MRWRIPGIVAVGLLLGPIVAQADPLLGEFQGYGTGSGTGHGEFATFNFYEPPSGASYNVLGDVFIICTALADPLNDCGTDGEVVPFTGNLGAGGLLEITGLDEASIFGSFIDDLVTIAGVNEDGGVYKFVASRVVNVPEPDTLLLFGCALAVMAFLRRRGTGAAAQMRLSRSV